MTPTKPTKQKALCYITRERAGTLQVLVFDHIDFPAAGTQVPAGTIDPGEMPEQAALREAFEESGVTDLQLVRYLGAFPWLHVAADTIHERHVFHLVPTQPLADQWVHIVSDGVDDKGLRFAYFWMDVAQAAHTLAGGQGIYLQHLTA